MMKLFKCIIVFAMAFSVMPFNTIQTSALENITYVDHTRGQNVSASANDVEVAYWGGDKTIDGIVNRDDAKPDQSRWSSNVEGTGPADKALTVNLGSVKSFDRFIIEWERTNIDEFIIEVSDDGTTYSQAYISDTSVSSLTSTIDLQQKVSGQYVRLTVTEYNGGDIQWASVSLYEFRIQESVQNTNLAVNKSAFSQSDEVPQFGATNAVDGDDSTRWASGTSQLSNWLYVDLESVYPVANVQILWERLNAKNVEIQVATTLSNPMNEQDWTTVHGYDELITSHQQNINLSSVVDARYVRVKINEFTPTSADTDFSWPTVSIFELKVHSFPHIIEEPEEPEVTLTSISNEITLENPLVGDTKLDLSHIEALNYEGFTIEYNGTDYQQVIGSDLSIYTPVVDTVVKPNFKITNTNTGEYAFKETPITVPGTYTVAAGDNSKPQVIPELREWKGNTGSYFVLDTSKIIVQSNELLETANIFASDIQDMTGKSLTVQVGGTPATGDFNFILTSDVSKGYQEEGYLLNIDDYVTIEATTTTGAYYGTRSILQIIQASDTMSISKGIARDYPLYEVRGFMLDVGRKTFELEYLYDLMEEMSWYKLNDFQLHLNDNYIFLEDYTNAGLDPMDAYSGFRLESSIVEGGNGGLNQADLTSKDVYYTKAEYVDLVNKSEIRGVTIVPEFDTPAHSLALTQVRPDLRQGTISRENDHLDLINNYQECIDFVQSIFLEYMEGTNPVFPIGSTVHLGLDEYTASSAAFRTFSNDMIDFAKDEGYQPRVWGSLTQLSAGEEVLGDGVQMNLWNNTWANFKEMYELGFDLINTNDGDYYIVPDAGYYHDYLNKSHIYTKDVNSLGGTTIPAGDSQMLGGMFAVWNDQVDMRENGTSEYDVYVRIKDSIPYFASVVWGKLSYTYDELTQIVPTSDEVPNTNLAHDVSSNSPTIAQYDLSDGNDDSGNDYNIVNQVNASYEKEDDKQVLALNGGESYVETSLDRLGVGNSVSMKVKRTSDSTEEQILLESSNSTIKAVQKDTGKVGFSREGHDYSFNYTLPTNIWVELEIKTEFEYTYLYVDGVLVDTLGDEFSSVGRTYSATLMLPIQMIGSKTNSFIGFVDEVTVQSDSDHISTMPLERTIINAKAHLQTTNDKAVQEAIKSGEDLIASNTYTKQQLDDAIQAIEEAIRNSSFVEANYTKIDILMNSVSKDTSLYTEASYANLLSVYNSIPQGLHQSFQDVVDAFANQLQQAINSLVVKTNTNLMEIDNATMIATASSYQDAEAAPSKALDNDPSTIWHTSWYNTPAPHYLEIELNEVTTINKISYLTRPAGGANGNIENYNIEVSIDGTKYTRVTEGTLSTAYGLYEITFDAVDAKYVRINIISGAGNFGSAAEIDIYHSSMVADFDALQEAVNEAMVLSSSNYSQDTWNQLQTILDNAKQLLQDTSANAQDVYNSRNDLIQAMANLQYDPEIVLANYDKVDEIIKKVEELVKEYYENFAEVETAIANVEENLSIDKQETVDSFVKAIQDAIDNLQLKAANYDALNTVLTTVPKDLKIFTEDSVSNLNTVIATVDYNLLIDKQSVVDDYVKNIQNAINHLQLKTADYTNVEALIKEFQALDHYKYVSVTDVQTAIDSVVYDKDITMQTTVDSYAENIQNAIDTLALKSVKSEVAGANQTITDISKPIVFTVANGNYDKFMDVYLNGIKLDKSNYNVKPGSITVELAPTFLATLSSGNQVLEIVTTDTIYSTNFAIETTSLPNDGATITPAPSDTNVNVESTQSPATGDNSNIMLYVLVLASSSVWMYIIKRKKTN